MSGCMRGLQILIDQLKLSSFLVNWVDFSVELLVVRIKLVLRIRSAVNESSCNFDFSQGLKHLDLLLDLYLGVKTEVDHL